jgi:hypothetical protein
MRSAAAAALLFATAVFGSPFRFERSVTAAKAGPNRLDVDAALLAGGAPLRYTVTTEGRDRTFTWEGGLEDLRLYDSANREVPYLLVAPPVETDEWKSGAILPIAATKVTSGFEIDLHSPRSVDRLRLDGIRAPFLKRVRLEGSGDRARWTILADATVFDLPEQALRHLEIAFTPGPYRYLRVTWDDRSSARVTGVGGVAVRMQPEGAPPPAMAGLPIVFQKRASEPGKSRYRLRLPGSHLPIIAIDVDVRAGNVFRDATVSEPRLTGSEVVPVPLGESKLRRAEREGGVAADLSIPIVFPEGADLELVVGDGNNPPLSIAGVTARLAPLPWIYFESPKAEPLVARFGNAALRAPAYDLEASRRAVAKMDPPRAQWSKAPAPVMASSDAEEAALPLAGATVERGSFRFSRPIAQSGRGLTLLLLDADVLARSRDLSDVRIVDASGHQVPYVVERRDEPLKQTLAIPKREADGSSSRYTFALPYDTLPTGTRLVITTSARVFERTVTLRRAADERRGREAAVLGLQEWRSADPELVPPAATFDVPLAGTTSVELLIDEGDNAPLPIATAELLLPSFALRFYRTSGALTLVYGKAGAPPPRYDLSLLAPRLFAEPATEITLAQPAADRGGEDRTAHGVFWAVIAGAVLVLLVILVRLLRH